MTLPSYGVTHHGRIVRTRPLPDSYDVEVSALAESGTLGPFESTVPDLAVGDRVLLTQIGVSQTDLVIIGRLPPVPLDSILPIDIADVTGLQTTLTGLQAGLDGKQPLDADLTTIAGLTATTNSVMQAKAGAWSARTPAQLKTDLILVKADVGLGSVDNTADTAKPVSTAQQAALNGKQPLDADLTTIAGLTAATDSVMQAKAGAWAARTIPQVQADLGIGPPPAVKSADEAVATSTALQDDNHLSVTVAVGTYLVELEGVYNSLAAAGFKTQFVGPAGTTGTIAGFGNANAFHGVAWNGVLGWGGAAADIWFRLLGRLVFTTAGTFKLQWAQSVSNVTGTTLYTGSLLRLTLST